MSNIKIDISKSDGVYFRKQDISEDERRVIHGCIKSYTKDIKKQIRRMRSGKMTFTDVGNDYVLACVMNDLKSLNKFERIFSLKRNL